MQPQPKLLFHSSFHKNFIFPLYASRGRWLPPLQLPAASQWLSATQFREGWWSTGCVKSHRYKCLATRARWEVYPCCWVRTAGGRRWRKRGTTPLRSWRPPSSWSCSGYCREGAWPPLCICRTTNRTAVRKTKKQNWGQAQSSPLSLQLGYELLCGWIVFIVINK